MTKPAALLLLTLAAAAAVTGCSGSDSDDKAPAVVTLNPPTSHPQQGGAPAGTGRGTTAPTTPAGLREQSCRDSLEFLTEVRAQGGPDAARQSAEDAIENLPDMPGWAALSAADRAAMIAGIRDAANGTCQG